MKLKTLTLLCSFFSLLFSAEALSIKIDKLRIYETAKPGDVIQGLIKVFNDNEKESLPIFTGMEDFSYDTPNQSVQPKPLGTQNNSCSRWIQWSPKQLTLSPRSSQSIQYVITVPKEGLEHGEYFSILYVESGSGNENTGESFVITGRGRMAVIVKIQIDKIAAPQGQISDFKTIPGKEGNPMEILCSFKNDGNTIQKVNGSFSIIDKEGNLFGRGTLKQGIATPGAQIEIKTTWDGNLEPGKYDLVAELLYDPDVTDVKETEFTVG
jgi:hypothetical protein